MAAEISAVQINSEERLFEVPPFMRAPIKKACPNFFTCKDKSPTHINSYLHPCAYGQDCRDIMDPHHTNMFYHYNNPICDSRNCDVTDPYHRSHFHHPNLWDYIIPCNYGQGCREINSYEHKIKYSHYNHCYPEIPKELQ